MLVQVVASLPCGSALLGAGDDKDQHGCQELSTQESRSDVEDVERGLRKAVMGNHAYNSLGLTRKGSFPLFNVNLVFW